MLDFSVKVDFSKVFNWNVKQVFLYLVAEYQTKQNVSVNVLLHVLIIN